MKGFEVPKFAETLEKEAAAHGMDFKKCSTYHYQVHGVYLLNIYPTSERVHIQGSNAAMHFKSVEELLYLANGRKTPSKTVPEKRLKPKQGYQMKMKLWSSGIRNCFVCLGEFRDFSEVTLEHKVPLSRGGSNRYDNLALSHEICNHARGDTLTVAKI